jgi:hypothetical protein
MLIEAAKEEEGCPRPTGVPPHVALLNQMARLQVSLEENTKKYTDRLTEELNKRHVGGDTFIANEILADVRRLNDEMRELMRFGRGGTMGEGGGRGNNLPTTIVPDPEDSYLVASQPNGPRHIMYLWGGKMRGVPQGFVLPKMSLQTLIIYWFCGSQQPRIPPLHMLKAHRDFPEKKNSMKSTLCQMRRLVHHVKRAGGIRGFSFIQGEAWTSGRATRLYELVAGMFAFPSVNNRERRHSQLSWKTVHDQLIKNDCKLVGE